ncbi:hypothetical protein Gohar_021281, partial [Gossypium harknessii]|nr:hypothetical protein [Gossypium harknessii]
MTQNNLQELKEIWAQWDDKVNYFTFGKVDLVPTVEEYTALLRCLKIQVDRAYSRVVNVPTFAKKLMNITGMSEQWVTARIRQKGESKCIPWKSLRDLILAHSDTKKKVDVFALSIYGLVIFPKALGHIDEAVLDLFDRLDRRVTVVPTILAETFRSLNACRRMSFFRVFSENYSPLKELAATLRRNDITKEIWMMILQNLQKEDVEWKAPWMVPDEILYRCGDFDWFIPVMQRLAQCEFSYKGDKYKKNIPEMSNTWNQTHWMKIFAVGPITTLEYYGWWNKRVNDNISRPSPESVRPMEEYLQ